MDGAEEDREMTWVPPGHFYSPLVDPSDDQVVRAVEREAHPDAPLSEFGIDEAVMLRWFDALTAQYASHKFPERRGDAGLYYYANPQFPLADALALQTFLIEKRPRRYVEIGSGFSSCAAVDVNERYLAGEVDMKFIEPYPEPVIELFGPGSPYAERIVRARLQDVGTCVFESLAPGDILFIDSSHVAKTGSDVLDYMFRVLPVLQHGVLVHIHDIFFPFEYPRAWIVDQNRSWNEAYLLRALLQGGSMLRVLLLFDWFYKCRRELLAERMPQCIEHRGGSIWLERR